MLYFNLIDDEHKKRERRAPLALALFSLFTIAVLYPLLLKWEPASVRPLGIEEREAVVALFTSLSNRVPELSSWAEETREVFEEDALPAFVDGGAKARGLVRYEDDTLWFSPRFFDADSLTQQNALLDAVVAVKQPTRAREEGVAYSSGD